MTEYLKSIEKQFRYYKFLGDKTLEQLDEKHLFWQYNETSNSIAIIVNHLGGNMLSRWTDFLQSDGEKEFRNRDLEFEDVIKSREQLQQCWEAGWTCLFSTLDTLSESDLTKTIYIRNQGHSVLEAINRQLAHYSYHVGQMVYIGKMVAGTHWESLSIPKGASKAYNKEKFDHEKHKSHFTEDYLNKKG